MFVQITTVPDQPNSVHRAEGSSLARAIENMRRDPPHGLTSADALAAAKSLLTRMRPGDLVDLVRAIRDTGLVSGPVGALLVREPIPFEIAPPESFDLLADVDLAADRAYIAGAVDGKLVQDRDTEDDSDEPADEDATAIDPNTDADYQAAVKEAHRLLVEGDQ